MIGGGTSAFYGGMGVCYVQRGNGVVLVLVGKSAEEEQENKVRMGEVAAPGVTNDESREEKPTGEKIEHGGEGSQGGDGY